MNEDKLVVIFMGSKKDSDSTKGIKNTLDDFNIPYGVRALSAHKVTSEVLEAMEDYDSKDKKVIFIVVAGKSNALGPVIAGNSSNPVINCPVIGSCQEDLFSSLRMPTAVPCSTVLKPKNAALHAIEIFSLMDPELKRKFESYRSKIKEQIKRDDKVME